MATYTHLLATIAANTCESETISVRRVTGMLVYLPSAWTAAGLGIKVSPVPNTTFKPLYIPTSYSGLPVLAQVASVKAGQAYVMPTTALDAGYIKLWSQNGHGNNVNQTADRKIGVSLK